MRISSRSTIQTVVSSDTSLVDTIPANTSTTFVAPMNDFFQGYIANGDVDWIRVFLIAGQNYTFRLSPTSSISSPFGLDPYLTLYDPLGDYITYNDDYLTTSLNSQITYSAVQTGYYFLAAESFGAQEHGSYSLYSIGNATPALDLIFGSINTNQSLTPGGSTSSLIDTTGDTDWFSIVLQAGQTYTFTLKASGASPLKDPLLSLFNSSGTLITQDDDSGDLGLGGGYNSQLVFTATQGGTYYLGAGGYGTSNVTGNYTLAASAGQAATVDAQGGDQTSTATLAIGATVSSIIDTPGDQDWFAVNLVAGQTYAFAMNVDSGSILTDPYLKLFNASGSLIAIDDDGGTGLNSLLTFTAQSTGKYFIAATGVGPNQQGAYTLSYQTTTQPSPTASVDWGRGLTINDGYVDIYFAAAGEVFDGQTSAGWNAYEIAQTMVAANTFSQYINLQFRQTANAANADFRLVIVDTIDDDPLTAGYFYPPSSDSLAGIGVFARAPYGWTETGNGAGLQPGGYGFTTIMHEMAHGLGLAHPFDNGGTSSIMMGVTAEYDSYGLFNLNQGVYTLMGYNDGWPLGPQTGPTQETSGWEATPMALDVAVLQARYGANTTANSGDTVYTLNPVSSRYYTIWDTGGTDTIAVDPSTAVGATINLQPATLLYEEGGGGYVSYFNANVYVGVTIANGVQIENATGGQGSDTITGNSLANTLNGQAGSDTLFGGDGADVLIGGSGGDALNGGLGTDTASYASASGGVTVFLGGPQLNTGDAQGDSYVSIENLTGSAYADILGGLVGGRVDGGDGNDWIYGTTGAESLLGGNGNDVLEGREGADALDGGDGADVASYRNSTAGIVLDMVTPGNSAGDAAGDTLTNVENIWGSAYNDTIRSTISAGGQVYGFEGNDTLAGSSGNDVFYGGTGVDTLTGGGGVDDAFYLSWNDHYNQYGTLEAYEGGDTITDFTHGTDRIIVSRYWFGFGNIGGPAAALTTTHADFITSGGATSTRPTFFWNDVTKVLQFDPDGTGASTAVTIATLTGATLTLSDIWTA